MSAVTRARIVGHTAPKSPIWNRSAPARKTECLSDPRRVHRVLPQSPGARAARLPGPPDVRYDPPHDDAPNRIAQDARRCPVRRRGRVGSFLPAGKEGRARRSTAARTLARIRSGKQSEDPGGVARRRAPGADCTFPAQERAGSPGCFAACASEPDTGVTPGCGNRSGCRARDDRRSWGPGTRRSHHPERVPRSHGQVPGEMQCASGSLREAPHSIGRRHPLRRNDRELHPGGKRLPRGVPVAAPPAWSRLRQHALFPVNSS
jgi:hypothetical protein